MICQGSRSHTSQPHLAPSDGIFCFFLLQTSWDGMSPFIHINCPIFIKKNNFPIQQPIQQLSVKSAATHHVPDMTAFPLTGPVAELFCHVWSCCAQTYCPKQPERVLLRSPSSTQQPITEGYGCK